MCSCTTQDPWRASGVVHAQSPCRLYFALDIHAMNHNTSDQFDGKLASYNNWLLEQGLSAHTRRAYQSRVQQLLSYFANAGLSSGVLDEERSLVQAVFDYWVFLKDAQKMGQGSLNNTLTAIDSFCDFLGFTRSNITSLRQSAPSVPSKTLTIDEQSRFLDAVERRQSTRDKALGLVLLYTGVRLRECHALNVQDVQLNGPSPKLIVRENDKSFTTGRELPLNEITRKALSAWLSQRTQRFAQESDDALFLNFRGARLAIPGIDFVIRSIGWSARLELSAQTLRRTFLVTQLDSGQSSSYLAQIAGHKDPATIRRYLTKHGC